MNNDKLSFTDWEFWMLGSAYGVVILAVLLAFIDSVNYVIPGILGGFALFLLAISSARRKRNKRWLDEFNKKHEGSLDLDVVVAVTNRVCTIHRSCPPQTVFKFVAEALYHRSRNIPPFTTYHKWAINAYEELYGE